MSRRKRGWAEKRWFWRCLGFAAVLSASLLVKATVPIEHPTYLLDGSPQFTVLSLLIALSVYLRHVQSGARETWALIREGKVWNFPLRLSNTRAKLNALERTSETLNRVAPMMISLSLLTAGRIALAGFAAHLPHWVQVSLYFFDVLILISIAFLLIGLACVHLIARRNDSEIRAQMRRYVDLADPLPPVDDTKPATKAKVVHAGAQN